MSNLNWPESATHYGSETLQFNPGFYKKDGDKWLFMSDYFAPNGVWNPASKEDDPSRYIERPTAQLKQWSGPQDGLPPVGTVCEFYECCEWREVEVMYLSKHTVLLKFKNDEHDDPEGAYTPEDMEFRAIKTAEQLATEQRETAIREFMDIVGTDCRVTAGKAVDAGFKLEVV
jgi:hypothetical protein